MRNLFQKIKQHHEILEQYYKRTKQYYGKIKQHYLKSKHKFSSKRQKIYIATSMGILSIALVSFMNTKHNAYAITIGDDVVAIVKEEEEAKIVYDEAIEKIKQIEGKDISILAEVQTASLHSDSEEIVSKEEAVEKVKDVLAYQVEAYVLWINGEEMGIAESKEDLLSILEEIAKEQLPEGSEIELTLKPVQKETYSNGKTKEVSQVEVEVTKLVEEELEEGEVSHTLMDFDFHEEVSIGNVYVDKEEIVPEESILEKLYGDPNDLVQYELVEGDNIWDIAIDHGTTMDELLRINPQITDERRMQIGEVINLQIPTPLLSIATTQRATYREVVPAEIEYVAFSDMYEGDTKVYEEGQDGLNEVTVDVHKVNGIEVGRTLIERKEIQESKTKVIAYGVKERASSQPVARANVDLSGGSFMHPLNGAGTISSGYGSRWGSFHYGIDIAASAGTPIYAAASGTVTYSGYNSGGYGNLIIIEHDNGVQTYYGHCKDLYAQVGQSVLKGENIATVGSTGNSTGNHLHFEIRNGNSPINPYSYIY